MNEAYEIISSFYGDRKANRSQVSLINHIDEGIEMLRNLKVSQDTIDAYCIHPIVQNDEDVAVSHLSCYNLAVEYKKYANSYLCREETDDYTIEDINKLLNGISNECVFMLYADKMQNMKDFIEFHHGKHERSLQLQMYFAKWIAVLTTRIIKIRRYNANN